MYYIGLDVHKKTISYCVKDASGQVHREGQVGATRWELDSWMKNLPQPWTVQGANGSPRHANRHLHFANSRECDHRADQRRLYRRARGAP
jgi:hypothetical protein